METGEENTTKRNYFPRKRPQKPEQQYYSIYSSGKRGSNSTKKTDTLDDGNSSVDSNYKNYINEIRKNSMSVYCDKLNYPYAVQSPHHLNTDLYSKSPSSTVSNYNDLTTKEVIRANFRQTQTNQSGVNHKVNFQKNRKEKKFINFKNDNYNIGSSSSKLIVGKKAVGNLNYENKKNSFASFSTVLSKNHEVITNNYRTPINQDPDCDSDISGISSDLEKLGLMTAVDFDCDRYARHTVHESEIKDYVRTVTFRNSIDYCAEQYIKDKVVLVIRCGIGLLPLLCVRNGHAKKVIALEQSACIEYARQVVKDNMYSQKITLIQSSVHNLKQLPHGLNQVDVIVSDFMGECVLSQGDEMEQVIEARDRFLKANGLMLPMRVSLYGHLAEQRLGYENQRSRKNNRKQKKEKSGKPLTSFDHDSNDSDSSTDSTCCSWWSDVYGFDMRSKAEFISDCYSDGKDQNDLRKMWRVMSEPLVTFFDPCKVVSNSCLMKEFDMYKCTIAEVRHVQCKDLELKCITPYSCANGGDYAHMLELFMVVDFPNGKDLLTSNDAVEIGFSTSSFSPFTRYRQTGLLLRDQLLVKPGDKFTINEFHIWRGPQINQENKLFDGITSSKSMSNRYEENLKIRLRYTFVNQQVKAVDRRCVYTLMKHLF